MPDRAAAIARFLAAEGWGEADRSPLAGDASHRRYDRLARSDGVRAVLMDAAGDTGEDVRRFVTIARHLRSVGLSAPDVLAEAPEHGLLLLEDLGDDLLARVVGADPALERPAYEAAVDVLVHLHRHPAPADLAPYGPTEMAEAAMLTWDTYRVGLCGSSPGDGGDRARGLLRDHLLRSASDGRTLVLRDYHSENLIWLPQRTGPARMGLLDFQDAVTGHPAYDLASLLRDARRDVPPDIGEGLIRRYASATGRDEQALRLAVDTLSAQRNLRILGVFARLYLRDGKAHYLGLMPRVWRNLRADLANPALADLRERVAADLPEPTPEMLDRLKAA